MIFRLIIVIVLIFSFISCSKKEPIYVVEDKIDPYQIYAEGISAFNKNDFFFANKKFSEAELNFEKPELASKAAIMASFSLYAINFYDEALEGLQRFLKNYPADKNIVYAHYLEAIIYFEQIDDEKKDIKPLLEANKKIDFFIKKYPESTYATDLKFKKDLIQNQLAAKELYIARYYISIEKWAPAIKRLKNILNNYDQTIFIEEALHRLVEINYYLGLEKEAKEFAKILGYNYNSSEWYEKSYKILNKDYKIKKINSKKNKKSTIDKNFLNKIIDIFKQ
tara:strand:- start:2093 stop:2932 length:840 start_codon:yes stop_codon:yes gene_type:complete